MKKCLNRQVAARVSRHCKGCVFAALQKCEALWFSYPMVDVWWISQSCCRRFSTWRVHTPWLTRYLDSQRPESDFEAGKQILKTHGSHPLKGQVWLLQPRLDDEVNYVSSFIRGGIDPIWLSWDKPPATLAFPTKKSPAQAFPICFDATAGCWGKTRTLHGSGKASKSAANKAREKGMFGWNCWNLKCCPQTTKIQTCFCENHYLQYLVHVWRGIVLNPQVKNHWKACMRKIIHYDSDWDMSVVRIK